MISSSTHSAGLSGPVRSRATSSAFCITSSAMSRLPAAPSTTPSTWSWRSSVSGSWARWVAARERLEALHDPIAALDELPVGLREQLRHRAQLLEPLVEARRAQRQDFLGLVAADARGLARLGRDLRPFVRVAVDAAPQPIERLS